jgi:hypothetical protein
MSISSLAGGREAAEPPCGRPDFLTPLEYPPGELNALEAVTPKLLIAAASRRKTTAGPGADLRCE